ncbi:hypothetical protein R3W88_033947 [Solanum pinnatisectum]|uniref:Endonuclease/exonuclease/phosphatase domain-containing protein n=1 Tax=Solanum pinnatisectum TaxID=50273 RepID=A0AAV9K0M4_9SOLN|nr:hypothetical protein R3W88_033947 [Solanum pinnatisectum]
MQKDRAEEILHGISTSSNGGKTHQAPLTEIQLSTLEGMAMVVSDMDKGKQGREEKWPESTHQRRSGGGTQKTPVEVNRIVNWEKNMGNAQRNKMKFQFTVVYGLHSIPARIPLWTAIHRLSTHITNPWLIMGDFNSILTAEDRPIGCQIQSSETRDFQECITNCNLSRIADWKEIHLNKWTCVLHMPIVQVLVMDPLISDHSPLSINVEEHKDAKKRPFKFVNCLAQHPEFKNKINASWQIKERGMQGVWHNMMKVRRELKQLNQREYMKVSEKVHKLRVELMDMQSHMRIIPIPQSMIDE